MRNSTTISLLNFLKRDNFTNVWGHDFKIENNQIKQLGINSCDLERGFVKSDAVLIMNNNKRYEDLNFLKVLKSTNKPLLFYDSWQLFDPLEIKNTKGTVYASVGHRS